MGCQKDLIYTWREIIKPSIKLLLYMIKDLWAEIILLNIKNKMMMVI